MILSSLVLSSQSYAKEDPSAIFQRPLITGASVSANQRSMSPGRKLALRYTKASEIKTEARGGRPGRDTVPLVKDADLKDRSIIVGVDLFFWDSTLPDLDPSIKALDSIMKQAKDRSLPIVLGEIPELLPGYQPQRAKLNKAIKAACQSYDRCYLMPFDRLMKQVLKDGGIEMYGRKYTLREIVPDGLHLMETAGNYLADVMLEVIQEG